MVRRRPLFEERQKIGNGLPTVNGLSTDPPIITVTDTAVTITIVTTLTGSTANLSYNTLYNPLSGPLPIHRDGDVARAQQGAINCLAILLETSAQAPSRRHPPHHPDHRHSFGDKCNTTGGVGVESIPPSKDVFSQRNPRRGQEMAKLCDVPGFVASVAVVGVVEEGVGREWVERTVARGEGGRKDGGGDGDDDDTAAPMQARQCLGCLFGAWCWSCSFVVHPGRRVLDLSSTL